MSSGGGTSNTIQKSDPWIGAQPYLTDLMSKAQQTYNNAQGQTQAPSTYTPLSNLSQQGIDLTAQRALAGSPLINTADQSLTNVLQADPNNLPGNGALRALLSPASQANQAASHFADPSNINPFLKSEFDAASQPVIDAVNSQFGMGGRTGSAANQQVLTRNLGELASNIYGQGYDSAANRSLTAGGQLANTQSTAAGLLNSGFNTGTQQHIQGAALSPTLANQDYQDLQSLLTAGNVQDTSNKAQTQSILDSFNYAQQQPWNILQGYGGAINGLGNLGGTSTSASTQPGQSMLPQLLGTAATLGPLLGLGLL